MEPIVTAATKPTTYTRVADIGKWGVFPTASAAACINKFIDILPLIRYCYFLDRIKSEYPFHPPEV
jgi:hypothetical protein